MRVSRRGVVGVAAAAWLAAAAIPVTSQSTPVQAGGVVAVRGARLLPASGPAIPRGVIVVRGGKIAAIGAEGETPVPADATIIDASGATITPGLIDSHSHVGLGASGGDTEDNETSDPVTPQLRVIDSIHPLGVAPDRDQLVRARAEGVTTVIARPGSANVIGGQSAVLKLRGRTVDEMVVRFPADMKMALGRKGAYAAKNQMPTTKMGAVYLVRQAMLEAAEYGDALRRYEKERAAKPDTAPPPRDLKKEAMRLVADRVLPVHIHASGVDDILSAVRLLDEFGFSMLSLAHADESWRVADLLAARKVAVVVGPRMIVYDDANNPVNLAQVLHTKGVAVSIMTDADVVQAPFLRHQAAMAIRHGMDPADALRAITLNPARLARLEDRIGSLDVGKDADFVVFDGDPFDLATKVAKVFIDGVVAVDAAKGR